MRFKVLPRGMKGDDSRWTLIVGDDRLEVEDADGELVADWSGAKARDRVKTPSFWENRKGYGIVVKGQLIDFEASPRAREEIQALLDRAYARQHPDAAQRAVLFGLGKAGLGCVLAAAALIVT